MSCILANTINRPMLAWRFLGCCFPFCSYAYISLLRKTANIFGLLNAQKSFFITLVCIIPFLFFHPCFTFTFHCFNLWYYLYPYVHWNTYYFVTCSLKCNVSAFNYFASRPALVCPLLLIPSWSHCVTTLHKFFILALPVLQIFLRFGLQSPNFCINCIWLSFPCHSLTQFP